MARLNKQKVAEIINNRPEGTSPEEIIAALQKKGHTLEGFNDEETTRRTQQVAQRQDQKGTLEKVGDFFGISDAGRAIGSTIARATGSTRQVEEGLEGLTEQQDKVLKRIREKRARGEDTSRLEKVLKDTSGTQQQIAGELEDIGTGGVSNKEFLGSLALTAGNLALPFAGKTLQLGSKAAKLPSIARPIVRGQGARQYAQSVGGNIGRAGAVGGAFGAASGAEQDRDTKGIMQSATLGLALGGAIPAAGEAIRKTAQGAGNLGKLLSETFAQTPTRAIDYARANPQATREAIRRAANDERTVFKVANKANQAVQAMKTKRDTKFKKGLEKIQDQLKNKEIDPEPFNEKLRQALQRFDMADGQKLKLYDGFITDDREIRTIENFIKAMQRRSDLSATGWWKLKQKAQNLYKPTASNQYNALIGDITDAIDEGLRENVKGFGKLSDKFAEESKMLSFLQKELGVSSNAQGVKLGTEAGEVVVEDNTKRVINALSRALKENQPLANEFVQQLEKQGGKRLLDDLVGLQFASWLPRGGLQTLLGLNVGSIATAGGALAGGVPGGAVGASLAGFASPRAVGLGSSAIGDVQRGLRNIPQGLLQGGRQAGRQAGFSGGVRALTGGNE